MTETTTTTISALRLRDVRKSYPGVQALNGGDFECEAGEVHALVGENGSGKSTLVKVVSGTVAADSGTVEILGQRLEKATPAAARRLGVAAAFQDCSLAPELSVAQNLYLSTPPTERPPYARMGRWAQEWLDQYGLSVPAATLVGDLPLGTQQLVEVVKALVWRPKVLLLDEPTSALDATRVDHLATLVKQAAAEGTAVLYISHRLGEVLTFADRVTVLRDGEFQGTYSTENLSPDKIITLMVGNPLDVEFPPKQDESDAPLVFSVNDLEGERFRLAALSVRKGEIVGLAGAEGNGQRELLRTLAGLETGTGKILCDGRLLRLGSVKDALRKGVMLLSGDRARESVFSLLSVKENMDVQVLGGFARGGLLVGGAERKAVSRIVWALDIVTPTLEQPIAALSGGNQQKVVVGRAFLHSAKVLLLDEPTLGVDAGARLQIYRVLREKAAEGLAIIVNSSDALELTGLCDRVLVLSRGQVVSELSGPELTEDNIVRGFVSARATASHGPRAEEPATQRAPVGSVLGFGTIFKAGWLPLAVLVALMLIVGGVTTLKSSFFLTQSNMEALLILATPLAIVAMAQLSVLLVGGFDISVGASMSLVVVVGSYWLTSDSTGLLILGSLGAIAIGAAGGLVNGALVRGLRVNPVIATIAMLGVLQGIALILRPHPKGTISFEFENALTKSFGFVPWAFIGVVVVAIAGDVLLHRTGRGLTTRFVGFREEAARRVGIGTTSVHLRAYVLAGAVAGVAGLFLASQVGVGAPTSGSDYTLRSIAAGVLGGASLFGGRGSVVGCLVGALFLALTINVVPFLQIDDAFAFLATGALTMFAILVYSQKQGGRWPTGIRARLIRRGSGNATTEPVKSCGRIQQEPRG